MPNKYIVLLYRDDYDGAPLSGYEDFHSEEEAVSYAKKFMARTEDGECRYVTVCEIARTIEI